MTIWTLTISKLPIRQITRVSYTDNNKKFSKLPIRQITEADGGRNGETFSKLPIRQITIGGTESEIVKISKLPIRQITVKNKKILRYCLAVSFFLYLIPNLSSFSNI